MVYESRSSGWDRDRISERVLPDSLAGRFLTEVSRTVDNDVFMLNVILFKETGILVVFVVVINHERSNMYMVETGEDSGSTCLGCLSIAQWHCSSGPSL